MSEVKMCVVLTESTELNALGLSAYVLSQNPDPDLALLHSNLLQYSKQRLPSYMWPTRFHFVSDIPLKANGKVDKVSLSKMPNLLQTQPVVPRQLTAIEEQLVKMWSNALNKQSTEIDIELSFFDLGGHSLLIGRLINQIQAELSVAVSYQQFFESSSITQLAKVVNEKQLMRTLSAKQNKANKMTI